MNKNISKYSLVAFVVVLLSACSGSKKYFKIAEKMEKQGLTSDAADFYLESLSRNPKNVDARLKVKQVGQKHVSILSSDFFRKYNTQENEKALETFERLTDYVTKTNALGVSLDYPKQYDDDYKNAVDKFCAKNHQLAEDLIKGKKYASATEYISKVKKYNTEFQNIKELEIISICEPLYQSAVKNLDAKSYSNATNDLNQIVANSTEYKDSRQLILLAKEGSTKRILLLAGTKGIVKEENDIENNLYPNFSETIKEIEHIKLINSSLFNFADKSSNQILQKPDLSQAVHKALGADYFCTYEIADIKENNPSLSRTSQTAYEEFKVAQQGGNTQVQYKAMNYSIVKGMRSYSFILTVKIIDARNNQIISNISEKIIAKDEIEYNELPRSFSGKVNDLFPYNPESTPIANRYNPNNWRRQFTQKNNLKTIEQLKEETMSNVVVSFNGILKQKTK